MHSCPQELPFCWGKCLRLGLKGAESEMGILVCVIYKGGLSGETCKTVRDTAKGRRRELRRDVGSADPTENSGCQRSHPTKLPVLLFLPS